VTNDRDIRLVDAGDGRRLELFGERLVDRPHPGAEERRGRPGAWGAADLRFDRGRGWTGRADPASPWTVSAEGLTLELRATESGGIGLFPEQILNVEWLGSEIRKVSGPGDGGPPANPSRPAVLNLFAHTGLLTLAAARAGAAVTHVDAARGAVAWARRNA
jgi:23S rRNA (cytosine1962-C5)-methyltransferase